MLVHPTLGYRLELLHRPGSSAGRKPATPGEVTLFINGKRIETVPLTPADLDAVIAAANPAAAKATAVKKAPCKKPTAKGGR